MLWILAYLQQSGCISGLWKTSCVSYRNQKIILGFLEQTAVAQRKKTVTVWHWGTASFFFISLPLNSLTACTIKESSNNLSVVWILRCRLLSNAGYGLFTFNAGNGWCIKALLVVDSLMTRASQPQQQFGELWCVLRAKPLACSVFERRMFSVPYVAFM